MEDLRLYAVTYNVGTSTPEQDLHNFLSLSPNVKHDKTLPDFYIISLQEVKAQPQNLLLSAFFDDPWTQVCRDVLGRRDYVKMKTIRLQGIVLSVYCLRKHLLNIRDVESDYTRTGLGGMWGNKGAVSVRFSIYGCSLCFINSHLSAHDNMLNDRIEDYNAIVEDQKFHVDEHTNIFYHDYVFWMGDLNFRLIEEYEKTPEEIERSIQKQDLESLLKHDQLRAVMHEGRAFSELQEEAVQFPPTFKFEMDSAQYDHKRRPAWTDRILYRVNSNNYPNVTLKLQQNSYKSHPEYTMSDHKPVSGDFTIKIPQLTQVDLLRAPGTQVFADYAEEVVQFEKIDFWWADDENAIIYNITREIPKTREDWIGVFRERYTSLDDYILYEYVNKSSSPLPITRNPNHPRGVVQPKKYSIKFAELPCRSREEKFRLIYFSETEDKVQSVLGISEPFPIREKERD